MVANISGEAMRMAATQKLAETGSRMDLVHPRTSSDAVAHQHDRQ
jgi:hypothetical protein